MDPPPALKGVGAVRESEPQRENTPTLERNAGRSGTLALGGFGGGEVLSAGPL